MLLLLISAVLLSYTSVTCATEWNVSGDASYHAVTGYSNYSTAKAYCESIGGFVVTLHSEEEQNFVQGLFGDRNRSYWLGLEPSSGGWTWVDGTAFTLSSYHKLRDGSMPPATGCMMVGYDSYDYEWDDANCNSARVFYMAVVCKKYTATTTAEPKACTEDRHCSYSELCQYEQCLPYGDNCVYDDDCPEDMTCRWNHCGYPPMAPTTTTVATTPRPCTEDVHCTVDELCQYGECLPYNTTCSNDGDCPTDMTCRWSNCGYPPATAPPPAACTYEVANKDYLLNTGTGVFHDELTKCVNSICTLGCTCNAPAICSIRTFSGSAFQTETSVHNEGKAEAVLEGISCVNGNWVTRDNVVVNSAECFSD